MLRIIPKSWVYGPVCWVLRFGGAGDDAAKRAWHPHVRLRGSDLAGINIASRADRSRGPKSWDMGSGYVLLCCLVLGFLPSLKAFLLSKSSYILDRSWSLHPHAADLLHHASMALWKLTKLQPNATAPSMIVAGLPCIAQVHLQRAGRQPGTGARIK